MNTSRRQSSQWKPKNEAGRRLCSCGCGQTVQPPRRTWFSDACVRAWRLIHDPATIRAAVLDRDKGVCAHCGRDTEAMRAEYRKALFGARDRVGLVSLRDAETVAYVLGSRRPAPPEGFPCVSRTWWEADHIVPVVEGGGCCGLENYRTLCCPCHKKETAALARRRAEARRAAKQAAQNAQAPTLNLA